MITQIATLPKPSSEFKKFCNSLRCPLCDSQLDGNVHPKKAELYCVVNNNEYMCRWFPNEKEPDMECIKYWYSEYEYVISVAKQAGSFLTVITRFNTDASPYHKDSTRKELFRFQGVIISFFRKRMEEQVFLDKLKTYTLFS